MTGPLQTARQVADLLGVSPKTVLRWSSRGELPAVRLPGGAVRFRPDDLDAWITERTRRGREEPSAKTTLPTPPEGA